MCRTNVVVLVLILGLLSGCASEQAAQKPDTGEKKENIQYVETGSGTWKIHDDDRPKPPVITPPAEAGGPPSDAIVLFDGTDLSQWTAGDGKSPAKWVVKDGYMESVKGSGSVKTAQKFGSCQLHVEFATPANVRGDGQNRGNSGVFLQDEYEVQVLDSYDNETYADGQCSALYGRAVPLVNVCRTPGQWQSYDIVYHRPIFNDKKEVVRKAMLTVFQNGTVVQAHVALEGGTDWVSRHAVSDYKYHPDKGSIALQDHGNPVRYRNIWIRELAD